MSDLQLLNLRELTVQYRDHNKRASDAARMLDERQGDEAYLKELLRDHLVYGIYDQDELYLRDAVDELLSFYSLIEIACLMSFVPPELPGEFAKRAMVHLTQPALRVYYENYYPLLLPRQLRRRLNGEHRLTEQPWEDGPSIFMQLLNINDAVQRDEHVDRFLEFLDDYYGKYSWIDLRLLISDPHKFFHHMAIEPKDQTPLDHGLHGFRKFLLFCYQFDEFLEQLDRLPLFQSAAWHYHAYWFDLLRNKMGDLLNAAIEQCTGLAKLSEADEDQGTANYGINRLRQVIGRLIDSPYRTALLQVNAKA
jgi:hypothetical protein